MNVKIGNPISILLVEDDPAHAEIVQRNLSEFRVANHVFHVSDGQSALDYIFGEGDFQNKNPEDFPLPDLILLDLRLPKVDGLDVLRRVKGCDEFRHIPIVVLTTSSADMDLSNAYAEGAGSYLVKPVDFEKFQKLLESFGFYWLIWNRYPEGTAE